MSLQSKSVREVRKTLRTVGPMYVDPKFKKDGFEYRWVNDESGLISRNEQLGFRKVIDRGVEVGDRKASDSKQIDSTISINVGQGVRAYLMEIPKTTFDEIEEDKARENSELEAALGRDTKIPEKNQYGEIKIGKKIIK